MPCKLCVHLVLSPPLNLSTVYYTSALNHIHSVHVSLKINYGQLFEFMAFSE